MTAQVILVQLLDQMDDAIEETRAATAPNTIERADGEGLYAFRGRVASVVPFYSPISWQTAEGGDAYEPENGGPGESVAFANYWPSLNPICRLRHRTRNYIGTLQRSA